MATNAKNTKKTKAAKPMAFKPTTPKSSPKPLWQPQPKQAMFQARMEYEVLYGGATGGGKSDALITEALRQVHKPSYRAIILRKTVPQLRELIDRAFALYPKAFPTARYNAQEHTWHFASGAKIQFGSMHHEGDRFQYQGRRFDFIAFDELTHFTQEEYFYMFSRNRPGASGMRNYIRATANPGGIGHSWVKARFIDPAPPLTVMWEEVPVHTPNGTRVHRKDRIFVPSRVFDNEALLNNAPSYVASLAQLPTAEREALLYGNWASYEGQVFAEFKNDPAHYGDGVLTHVIKKRPLPKHLPCYRAFDFGFARPFAVLWLVVDETNTVFVVDELYGTTEKPNEGLKWHPTQIARAIAEREKENPLLSGRNIIGIADPSIFDQSRGESVAESMQKGYVYFAPADNTRLPGKMQIHERLAFGENSKPKLYFFENCKHCIRTLPQLTYGKLNVEDVDTTKEDHLYDALRYALMARPLAPKPNTPKPPRFDPLDLWG